MSLEAKRLTVENWMALLAGLTLAACDRSGPEVTAEKPNEQAATPAASVGAKEVPSAAPSGSAKAGAQKGCAPGACAPGACGGNK